MYIDFYLLSKNMAKYIGRQIKVWFGKEGTRGTAASSFIWTPKTDLSFNDKAETIQDESSIGSIVDTRDSFVIKKFGEWDFSGNVELNSFGNILLATLGSVTTTAASTGAYSHAFDLNNTNNTQTLTIAVEDPVEWDRVFPLSAIESLTITAEEGQMITYTASFKSKGSESQSVTISYSDDYKMLSRYSVFKVASNLAWLDAASAVCIKSFELTITKNIEDDYCLGSITPRDYVNKQVSIEGSFTAMYEATTNKDLHLNGTKKAIRFELVDTATTIGVSDNPTLSFDLPLAAFTEWDKTQGNDEVVMETITFKGLYSNTDQSAIEVEMINTKSSY